MLEQLTRVSFEPYLNTTFHVPWEGVDSFELELVEVIDKTPRNFPGEQFSLVFRGPSTPYLPQQIYPLEHPEMGRLPLFLVPVEQRKDGYRYEAYFNRSNFDDE